MADLRCLEDSDDFQHLVGSRWGDRRLDGWEDSRSAGFLRHHPVLECLDGFRDDWEDWAVCYRHCLPDRATCCLAVSLAVMGVLMEWTDVLMVSDRRMAG